MGRTQARATAPITILHCRDFLATMRAIHDGLHRKIIGAPDLVVITGNLARRATPAEYEFTHQALPDLRYSLGLPSRHIVVVPGSSDANQLRSRWPSEGWRAQALLDSRDLGDGTYEIQGGSTNLPLHSG